MGQWLGLGQYISAPLLKRLGPAHQWFTTKILIHSSLCDLIPVHSNLQTKINKPGPVILSDMSHYSGIKKQSAATSKAGAFEVRTVVINNLRCSDRPITLQCHVLSTVAFMYVTKTVHAWFCALESLPEFWATIMLALGTAIELVGGQVFSWG